MNLLKITTEKAFLTEEEARTEVDTIITKANEAGHSVAASSITHKTKKSKGEVIDERWITKITEEYEDIWA